MKTIYLSLPAPLHRRTHTLHLDPSSTLASIPLPSPFTLKSSYLRTRSSSALAPQTLVADLPGADQDGPLDLFLNLRVLGGKGGFGSQLRAAGGRMSRGQPTNNDSCRDLSGRRLSTIKEAKALAEAMEANEKLQAEHAEKQKAKLEALERTLGISTTSPGSGEKREASPDLMEIASKRHKFQDAAFLEESRELKEGVRNAVSAAVLLRKKKKAKAAAAASASALPTGSSEVAASTSATKDMPPPAVPAGSKAKTVNQVNSEASEKVAIAA